ncbi:MAG: hypothetical protein MZV64_63465 [Ignavibacteriales bacterium]|nr:hypothetical protein [Ignavibacteriales bacterium]
MVEEQVALDLDRLAGEGRGVEAGQDDVEARGRRQIHVTAEGRPDRALELGHRRLDFGGRGLGLLLTGHGAGEGDQDGQAKDQDAVSLGGTHWIYLHVSNRAPGSLFPERGVIYTTAPVKSKGKKGTGGRPPAYRRGGIGEPAGRSAFPLGAPGLRRRSGGSGRGGAGPPGRGRAARRPARAGSADGPARRRARGTRGAIRPPRGASSTGARCRTCPRMMLEDRGAPYRPPGGRARPGCAVRIVPRTLLEDRGAL